ncbi:hypothetical protein AAMO2058_001660400 [Amorphochlora amoebiformis]
MGVCSSGNADKIARAKKTGSLNLVDCRLKRIPQSVLRIDRLRVANFRSNKIKKLPNDLFSLQYLTILNLSNNHVAHIPESIIKLKRLKELKISGNFLEELPEGLWKLPSLRELDLSGNRLRILFDEEKMKEDAKNILPNVITLNLSSNQLSEISGCIGYMESLEVLDISQNHLSTLPKNFGNLNRIKTIHATNNNLSGPDCIPRQLLVDTKLFRLDLANNPIFEGRGYYKLDGFENFEKRAKEKGDKQVQGGLHVNMT